MKKNELYFEAIVDQPSEGMAVADPEGNCIYVKPAFRSMMGYSEEELRLLARENLLRVWTAAQALAGKD